MKGLLIRDFYVIKKGAASFLILSVIYAAIAGLQTGNSFFVWFLGFWSAMLPINIIAFDERSKWETLARTMPYTTEEIVSSKYIFSAIATILASVIFSAVNIGMIFFAEIGSFETLINNIMIILSMGFGFAAIELPFIIWLGVSKGRIIFIISVMLISIGISILSIDFESSSIADLQFEDLNIHLLTAAMLLSMIISACVSVGIYKRKEL